VEKVGDEGFKKAPVDRALQVRLVRSRRRASSSRPRAVWRKARAVKRLVFKSVPDESTRLAMLKRGEADVAYSIRGPSPRRSGVPRGSR